ncbi:hypothetical protein [Demequina sp. NBRC 110056]|uniref:hypothetical protein n=1 Tax=Demequina sp. NBRC 110056 TaxID=1570345 RepID=UPI0009FFDECF|nr:hypothetical protein [Demequina sp. NBRC 110056]
MTGAAWAAPAIVIASALPAAAASTDTPTVSFLISPVTDSGEPGIFPITFTVAVSGPTGAFLKSGATIEFSISRLDGSAEEVPATGVTFMGWDGGGLWSGLPPSDANNFNYAKVTYNGPDVVTPGGLMLTVEVENLQNGDLIAGTLEGESGGGDIYETDLQAATDVP